MSNSISRKDCEVLKRVARCLTIVGALSTAAAMQAQASPACDAVNSGALTLTNTALGPSTSAILTNWSVGDVLTVNITSSDGISRTDGLYHGPTFAPGMFGPLATTTVPVNGNSIFQYTIVASDLINGIAIDPENNDSVVVGCGAPPTVTAGGVSPNSGPATGGTVVTITGTNFNGVTTGVTFGGISASFTVSSLTSIIATTPAHTAGAVDVAVTTGTGTATAPAAFTYIAGPLVNSISPSSGRTAGGGIVTITGAHLTGATGVNFGPNSAPFTVNSDTQITAASPAANAGTVDITVTTSVGISATSPADQFTYFAPPIVVSISPNTGQTSGNTTVAITGANFTGTTRVNFGSNPASFTVNSVSQITAISPAANAGIVDVTVATQGGISATSTADQFTYGTFHAWVSSTGNDSNVCSRSAPCLTFAAAVAQTAPGGDISVLDAGDYGSLTINKSIIIHADQNGEAGAVAIGANGITVSAGTTDVVDLVGLAFIGSSSASGILINSAAKVSIENCVVQQFSAGISVTPLSGAVKVEVIGTSITGNSAGMLVKPAAATTANVRIRDSHLDNNLGGGLRVDGGFGGTSYVAVANTTLSLNANGINAVSGPGNVSMDISGIVVASNNLRGIQANQSNGGMAVVTVGNSIFSNNGSGAWENLGGATLLSFQNNQVTGPTGTPPSPASFQ